MGDKHKSGFDVTVEPGSTPFPVPKTFGYKARWVLYFVAWFLFYFSGLFAFLTWVERPCCHLCQCVISPEIALMFDCLEEGRRWCIDFALLVASTVIELRTGRLMLLSTSLAALAGWMLIFRLISF